MTSDFKPVLMPEKRDLMVKIYLRNGLFSMVLSNYFYFDISSIYSISVKVRRKTNDALREIKLFNTEKMNKSK